MTINVIKNVQSICSAEFGSHYCLFYKSKEDLIKLLAQYFIHGIENNEYCIWVDGDIDIETKAQEILFKGLKDRNKSEIKKQIVKLYVRPMQ